MNLLTLASTLLISTGAIGLVCVELVQTTDPRAVKFAVLHRRTRRRRGATVPFWTGLLVLMLGAGVLLLPGRH